MVFQERWNVVAVVSQDRFHCNSSSSSTCSCGSTYSSGNSGRRRRNMYVYMYMYVYVIHFISLLEIWYLYHSCNNRIIMLSVQKSCVI